MDFNFVTLRLGTGAAINGPDDVEILASAGFTNVIDCIAGADDTPLFAAHPSIMVLYNGVDDDGQPKPVEWFQKSIEFALDALAKPFAKVYAHCAAGVNRGPSTAYAILLALGLSPQEAEDQIRKNRPQVGLLYKGDAEKAVLSLGY